MGTPAITTRCFVESDTAQIAEWMKLAIDNRDNSAELAKLKAEVVTVAK